MKSPPAPARPRRIAFAGTPHDAVPALQVLAEAGFEVPVVVTGEPRRRSRRGSDAPSPAAEAAAELGLPVSHDPADLAHCGADCAVVVAFGQLIAAELLAVTPMLNLHFSLLPRWRGAAPVERALLTGDGRTGVSLMALEATLDTGPVFWQHGVPIGPADTAAGLRSRLANEGAQRLARSLADGLGTPEPQHGTPTYAPKLTPADRRIDWTQPAAHIDRQVRVGGAWTTLDGERVIIREAGLLSLPDDGPSTGPAGPGAEGIGTPGRAASDAPPGTLADDAVATGHGLIRLETVQPAGRGAIDAQAWLRGARLPAGARFG